MPRLISLILLLPAFNARIVHQLHVVDHDALDVVLQLEPPRLGAEVPAVSSPVNRPPRLAPSPSSPTTLARWAYSCDWSIPFRNLWASISPRAAQQTLGELLLGHFQTEHRTRLPPVGGDVLDHVHRKCGVMSDDAVIGDVEMRRMG